jgi:thiamine biosynthesis lipoprotein
LGTTVTLAVDRHTTLAEAEDILRDELDGIDRACSRFRSDSEIWSLYAHGRAVRVSPLLFQAVVVALRVAERTGGAVDPTVGLALEALGYDRDFADVPAVGPALDTAPTAAPGWWCVEHDDRRRTIRLPPGVHLDLGATAKALVVDRAAARIASSTGSGALVSAGGDLAVAGPVPPAGWAVTIAVDSTGPVGPGPVVAVRDGGLASSSTVVRSWHRGGRRFHHIIDPATGDSANEHWRLVSVAAATCVDANAASTAAIVWGERAAGRLESMRLPARLVRHDGAVVTVAGWPTDEAARSGPRRMTVDSTR